jgi:hypothetical protein
VSARHSRQWEGEGTTQQEQTVCEMVEEVLGNQANILVKRSGQSLEGSLEVVCGTEAGRQLRELAQGPHRNQKADEWQEGLVRERADKRMRDFLASGALLHLAEEEYHYSWVEGYVEWLEGKEAREQYYELLAEEFLHLKR